MRRVLKFFVPVVTIALAGCQQFAGQSPYEYRFDDNAAQVVCVSVTPHGNESLRIVHGSRYEAQATEKLPEATFGTPGDDEKVLIRALLNRIFPHPVPWKE